MTAIQETPAPCPELPFKFVDGKPPYFEYTMMADRIHSKETVEVPIRLMPSDSRYAHVKQLFDRCRWFEERVKQLNRELEAERMMRQTVNLDAPPKHVRKGQ